MEPGVDVVIPCYNYGRFLGEAISSAVSQSLPARSITVVDDGSTDETPEVIRSLLVQFPDVTFLDQPNRGLAWTLRRGIAAGTESFFAILSADDRWHPNFIEKTVNLLANNPQAGYCYTSMLMFGDQAGIFESRPFSPGALVAGNFVGAGALVRRDAYLATRGYREIPVLEDWDLWLSFLDSGLMGVFLDEPLYEWRQRTGSRNDISERARAEMAWRIRLRHPRSLIRYGISYRVRQGSARNQRRSEFKEALK